MFQPLSFFFYAGKCLAERAIQVTLEDGRRRLVAAVQTAMLNGYRLIDTTLFSGAESCQLSFKRFQQPNVPKNRQVNPYVFSSWVAQGSIFEHF